MLHILWLILKFILIALGWILGLILGLVLLILLLVLFCPIRYDAAVSKESDSFKEICAEGGVSWLFYLISVRVSYQNGKLDKDLRLFGIPVFQVQEWNRKRKEKKQAQKSVKKNLPEERKETDLLMEEKKETVPLMEEKKETVLLVEEKKETVLLVEEKDSKETENLPEKGEQKPIPEELPIEERLEDLIDKTIPDPSPEEKEEKPEKKRKKEIRREKKEHTEDKAAIQIDVDDRPSGKKENKIGSILEKIKAVPEKIRSIMENIEAFKTKMQTKAQWWKAFLGHRKTKAAIRLVKNSLVRIIKHVLPTRISGDVTFGLEDPALMGKILAILGMTIPFHKNSVRVTPLFDVENQAVGHLKLKGRIYTIVFVFTAIRILVSRNIWFVIRYWKNKEV